MEGAGNRTIKYVRTGFAGSILGLLLMGIIYRCMCCASPLEVEFLRLILTLAISGGMFAFVRYSVGKMYVEEKNSIPTILIIGGAACLIVDGRIHNAFLVLLSAALSQPLYHARNQAVRGIFESLEPVVLITILCQAVGLQSNIFLFIWLPTTITTICACLSEWYSPHRGRDTAVCAAFLTLFAAIAMAIAYRRGTFDIEINGLLRCLYPEQDPLRSGFPLLTARETMRTSVALGVNNSISSEAWSFFEQDNMGMWQVAGMVAKWGYISGFLVAIMLALITFLGIYLCRVKPIWNRWPSVVALAALTSQSVFYLLQNIGWTVLYSEAVPFFCGSVSWNATFLFLGGLIFADAKKNIPPLKVLYTADNNSNRRRRAA